MALLMEQGGKHGAGHKGAFVKLTRACGLEGKPTSDHAGDALAAKLVALAEELGPYPQPILDLGSKEKKQTTRLLKATCPSEECGYTIRVSSMWVAYGLPTCVCGNRLVEASSVLGVVA